MPRVLSLAALLGIVYLTKPSRNSFVRALRVWLRKRNGVLGETLARGALAVDSLSGPSNLVQDFTFFTVVQLKPTAEESALATLFENDDFFGAVGVAGHWIGVRVPSETNGRPSAPKVFYLGSALDIASSVAFLYLFVFVRTFSLLGEKRLSHLFTNEYIYK